jgi:mannose-6-phosphate isomerase
VTSSIMRLRCVVRDYAWGSTTLLADLRGEGPSPAPEAEQWLGAHPGAPSVVDVGGHDVALDQLIADHPAELLGSAVDARFGRLPYLLKLLAAATPLSLQAHPTIDRARTGFARENAAGVPLDAAERSYKDDNHKPELICAITPFRALAGFRDPAESAALLRRLDCAALVPIIEVLESGPGPDQWRALLSHVLTLPAAEAAALANEVAAAVRLDGPDGDVRGVARVIADTYPGDAGIVTALFLNTITLAPGEAIYLGAGLLHAYVDGLGVEIMASSDNVLRGGLTPKHVDVPELLDALEFVTGPVSVLHAEPASSAGGLRIGRYVTPAPEFELQVLEVTIDTDEPSAWLADAPQILVVTHGQLTIDGAVLQPADSVFVAPGTSVQLSGDGTAFVATVPNV